MPVQQKTESAEKSKAALKEVMDKLEQGVKDVFASEAYADYLKTMSRFHNYSSNNSLLIFLQNPQASLVAGFQAWQNNFDRHVKKGEKGIKIIAPVPYKFTAEVEKIGTDGKSYKEQTEITGANFRAISVFDVSQTDGKPLPEFVFDLQDGVPDYALLFKAVEQSAPCPVSIEKTSDPDVHGFYSLADKKIVVREGMSQLQTLKTLVHEVAHSKIHDIDLKKNEPPSAKQLTNRVDKRTREVEAESIAYTVCQHYGLDTSDYSFGYIAGWSAGKELNELRGSLNTIQAAAHDIISSVDERVQELSKNIAQIAPEQLPDDIPQSEHQIDPEKIATSIRSLYTQVKNADPKKVSGIAAMNMAVKRIQKIASELPPPEAVAIKGILPLGYKALYDTAADICKKHIPNITVSDPVTTLIAEKKALTEATRNLSIIADIHTGWDNSLAKEDLRNALAEHYITLQARSIDTAYSQYTNHLVSLGIGYSLNDINDTSQYFEEYYVAKASHIQTNPINTAITGDTFSIYQLKDIEETRKYRWQSLDVIERSDLSADIQNYDAVYTAPLDTAADTLDSIYYRFNNDKPSDFKGHSLSVSDIVVLNINGDEFAHYVDSVGFKALPDFWESQTPPPPEISQLVANRNAKQTSDKRDRKDTTGINKRIETAKAESERRANDTAQQHPEQQKKSQRHAVNH